MSQPTEPVQVTKADREVAEGWLEHAHGDAGCPADDLNCLAQTLAAHRVAAERAAKWIDVEKELPAINIPVLFVVFGNAFCEMGYRREENWESERTAPQDELITFDNEQVTHWQPTPAAPAAQTGEKERK